MATKSTAAKKKTGTKSGTSGSKASSGSRSSSRSAAKKPQKETKRSIEKKKSFLESEIRLIAALLLGGFMLLTDLGFLGAVGDTLLKVQRGLLGQGYILFAVSIAAAAAVSIKYRDTYFVRLKTVCVFGVLIDIAAILHLMFSGDGHEASHISIGELYSLSAGGASGGGLIGGCVTNVLKGLIGYAGAYLILIAVLIALVVIITEKSFANAAKFGAEKTASAMKTGAGRTIEAARNGQEQYRRIHRERVIRREAEREERRLRNLEQSFPDADESSASRNIFYDTGVDNTDKNADPAYNAAARSADVSYDAAAADAAVSQNIGRRDGTGSFSSIPDYARERADADRNAVHYDGENAYGEQAAQTLPRSQEAQLYANYGRDIIGEGGHEAVGFSDTGNTAAPFFKSPYTNNMDTGGVSFDTAVLGKASDFAGDVKSKAEAEAVNVREIDYDSDEIPFDETEEDIYKSYAHILDSGVISLDTAKRAGFAVTNSKTAVEIRPGQPRADEQLANADAYAYAKSGSAAGDIDRRYMHDNTQSAADMNAAGLSAEPSHIDAFMQEDGIFTGTAAYQTADSTASDAYTYQQAAGMKSSQPDRYSAAGSTEVSNGGNAVDVNTAQNDPYTGIYAHTDSADKAGMYFDSDDQDADDASYDSSYAEHGSDTDLAYGRTRVQASGMALDADNTAHSGMSSEMNSDSERFSAETGAGSDTYVTATGRTMTAPDSYEAQRILREKQAQSRSEAAGKSGSAPDGRQVNKAADKYQQERKPQQSSGQQQSKPKPKPRPYVFPRINLLEKGSTGNLSSRDSLRKNAAKLQRVLRDFGVGVTVTNVIVGPRVSRYELTPDAGVKVSKITSLTGDIKLALAAREIRIEAPIPGKSAVGVEVPNEISTTVKFRDLLESDELKNAKSKLCWGIGLDIGGNTIVSDIAKMPHVLVAGTTGSGKSVGINSLIMSILYRATPQEVKMILVDPKQVEFTMYNGIPHLLTPVVTTPEKALSALNWAVAEMNRRYKLFQESGTRNIKGYNEKAEKASEGLPDELKIEKLPFILIIIDELSELMMHAKKDVESSIVSLAQLARAAGIHLVVATQRPSVDVVTGLIKSNIPSRVAFKLPSVTDSRTILDSGGAESLLGNGDMLYKPGDKSSPIRVQGAFLSDEEVENVVSFVKKNNASDPDPEIDAAIAKQMELNFSGQPGAGDKNNDSDTDELFAEAGRLIITSKKASIGGLQRKFKIGFNRAARIMDQLCEAGVVGDGEGTKERHILMDMGEFESYLEEH